MTLELPCHAVIQATGEDPKETLPVQASMGTNTTTSKCFAGLNQQPGDGRWLKLKRHTSYVKRSPFPNEELKSPWWLNI